MKKIIIIMVLVSMPFLFLSKAYAVGANDFIAKASGAGEFEIESSKLALDKSSNADIKEFAQKMITDHTDASEKLKAAVTASGKDTSLIKGIDDKHQKMLNDLKKTSDDKFDKKYVDIQVDAHKEAVSLFKDYSKDGDDKTIKEFAAKTLPTLESHLDHVSELKKKYN